MAWKIYISHTQVSLENGLILSYDSRTLSSSTSVKAKPNGSTAQPKFTLSAHDGAASAFDVNPHVRGCLVTGGMDKLVKIWNVNDSSEIDTPKGRQREISLATSRDLGLVSPPVAMGGAGADAQGKVFTARWSPDVETPLTLAAAGSEAKLQVWDVASNPGARKAFGERFAKGGRALGEVRKGGGIISVDAGEDDEDAD